MYGREYDGKELRFEPSGGLIHSSLVMQDKETDTYWSLMEGRALAGELEGTPLVELPAGEKTTWGDWVARYPESLVLSVDGFEHDEIDPYENYFDSSEGFRGAEASNLPDSYTQTPPTDKITTPDIETDGGDTLTQRSLPRLKKTPMF